MRKLRGLLSKLLCLGMGLREVVAGATTAPRAALRLEPALLEPGRPAEFTLFGVEDSDLVLADSYGDELAVTRRIMPKAVVWRGVYAPAASRLPTGGSKP